MITIQTAEHAFATAASKMAETARFVRNHVIPALRQVQAAEPIIEAVTGTIDPQAVNLERVGFALLGMAIKAIDDAGTAADANGLNVTLDASVVADIKALIPAVKSQASLSSLGK